MMEWPGLRQGWLGGEQELWLLWWLRRAVQLLSVPVFVGIDSVTHVLLCNR